MALLVYYSSATGNTRHFVKQLNAPLLRLDAGTCRRQVHEPFVLVVPTYADGEGRGAVPKPVMQFLNDEHNRVLLRGVIAGGNRNFGWAYALAGPVIAEKCNIPCLYRFELRGTAHDVTCVKQGLEKFWRDL
ncbi:MAG: Protein NrdI [Candidatus Tokpelaia hoelldobleri]|uniref:Protein NrdI n=1 Tax=Candidatus Tokpelaia hoelldobleri TaxID=1902579 RepID=A0A1U9JVD5_9HYPH|nr:MAG: Protein NrdI [Candidatus Tokpelaia hoelldoblerii]